MTISTYAELQSRVADFLVRTDLTAQIPTFIRLAEADMNRRVRHWKMEQRAAITLAGQFTDLPGDWMETKRLVTDRALEPVSIDFMQERRYNLIDTPGTPKYFSHSAGQIEVLPTPDASRDASLLYFARIPALSDAEPTNWLLDEDPDAYLYGALMHSSGLLQEDERIATWGGLYADAVRSINGNDHSVSGTGLRMR